MCEEGMPVVRVSAVCFLDTVDSVTRRTFSPYKTSAKRSLLEQVEKGN